MTDPTPTSTPPATPAPVVVAAVSLPPSTPVVVSSNPAGVSGNTGIFAQVETDFKAVEAKAQTFWQKLAAHPVLVVLVVLGAAAFADPHFLLNIF
jgi:hypothetical protein